MKILIIDDNPKDRIILRYYLQSRNNEVMEAENGQRGLEIAGVHKPDLIISDALMPEMDGFRLLRNIKKDKILRSIPFIFYSSVYTGEKEVELALSLGAEAFIAKPKGPEEFCEELNAILEGPKFKEKKAKRMLLEEEEEFLRRYSHVVVMKLEEKVKELEKEIAERIRAELALRESEAKFRTLMEHIPAITYIAALDEYSTTLYISPQLQTMLGFSPDEWIADHERYLRQIAPDDRNRVLVEISRSQVSGEPFTSEYRMITRDGRLVWIRDKAVVVRDDVGRPLCLQGIMFDTTEHKRMEKEKEVLEEQLLQSQKMEAIGKLAGGIAHDFNNLLTIIKGYSQLSLPEIKEGDPLKDNLKEINKAASRAADLTRQLLAFSRRQILDMKVLDLNIVLQNLDKMFRRVIGEDIELVNLLAEDLGRVKADPGQIEQVIMNLAVNARDAMPNGGKLTIKTANLFLDEEYARTHLEVTPGRYVVISMSDTGVGMTPEVKERAFEPFYTTKETGKGTGLGLSTVYGIVKQSGGYIWIESEPGKGTIFNVHLPRVDEPLEEIRENKGEEEIPRGKETVLVVEDEEDVRKLAIRILKRQGYRVLEASQGGEALLFCEKEKDTIHLILTDVVMPQMSGAELIERLRKVRSDFRVLYMSGYTDNAIVHHGILKEGMNYIQKPFTVDGLIRKVREVLDKGNDER